MGEIWKPLDNSVYKQWVQDILDESSDELNGWQSNFISDMEYKLNAGWTLTKGQADKLEEIYTEMTS